MIDTTATPTPTMRAARSTRTFLGLLVTGIVVVSVSACGSATVATCAEYAGMSSNTGLLESRSDAQTQALKVSLDAAGYDDGAFNQTIGHTEILAYCNIYDGVASSNPNEPISNAH